MAEKSTKVDGLHVRYLEGGPGGGASGQPVLLLHGASLGSSADVFNRNFRPLAMAGLRPIAVDRPGYGESDGPGDRTAAGYRRFILGFLDALGIASAVVVGHSQQGTPAAYLALEQPDRVPRAVILGSGSLIPPAPGGGPPEGEGDPLDAEPTPEQSRAILEANLYHHDLITPEELALRHRMSLGRNFTYYAQRAPAAPPAAAATPQEPLWRRIGANPTRFLLLYGRNDKPSTAQRCELAQQMFPDLRLRLLDECSHMVHWDRAADFERETIAFVNEAAVAV